jgi:hypothetical protein
MMEKMVAADGREKACEQLKVTSTTKAVSCNRQVEQLRAVPISEPSFLKR